MTPDPTLTDLRHQIDTLDAALLKLLSKRFHCCTATKELKESIEDADREDVLKANWRTEAASLGLSEEFVLDLLDRVLTESKRIQKAQ